jgi:hypothetical protein
MFLQLTSHPLIASQVEGSKIPPLEWYQFSLGDIILLFLVPKKIWEIFYFSSLNSTNVGKKIAKLFDLQELAERIKNGSNYYYCYYCYYSTTISHFVFALQKSFDESTLVYFVGKDGKGYL